jgi:hypothetical protein
LPQPTGRAICSQIMEKDKEREERLAAALRENLKRRKAQSRDLADGNKEKDYRR